MTTKFMMALTDPNRVTGAGLPKSPSELELRAESAMTLAFDNVSAISPEMSDALCRVITGATGISRTLYSNLGVTLAAGRTCQVYINGISLGQRKPDLIQRSVDLRLVPISKSNRRSAKSVEAAFEQDRAKMVGVIYDAVSKVLAFREPFVNQGITTDADGNLITPDDRIAKALGIEVDRMADYSITLGILDKIYGTNTHQQYADMVNANLFEIADISPFIEAIIRSGLNYFGTPVQILNNVLRVVDLHKYNDEFLKVRKWPSRKGSAPANALRRHTEVLNAAGYDVIVGKEKDRKGQYEWQIIRRDDAPELETEPSGWDDDEQPKSRRLARPKRRFQPFEEYVPADPSDHFPPNWDWEPEPVAYDRHEAKPAHFEMNLHADF